MLQSGIPQTCVPFIVVYSLVNAVYTSFFQFPPTLKCDKNSCTMIREISQYTCIRKLITAFTALTYLLYNVYIQQNTICPAVIINGIKITLTPKVTRVMLKYIIIPNIIRKCPLIYIPINNKNKKKVICPTIYNKLRSVASQKPHYNTQAYPLNNHIMYQNTEFKTPVNGEYLYLKIPIITMKHKITKSVIYDYFISS